MKNKLFLSQDFLRDLISQLQFLTNSPESMILQFNDEEIIFEEDLAKKWGIHVRTLRNYRNQKKIRYFSLFGRIVYLRTFLYLDILTEFYRHNNK